MRFSLLRCYSCHQSGHRPSPTLPGDLPKSFPFPPNACPSPNGPANVPFGTLLSRFFSITCSGLALFWVARVTPRSCPLASAHLYEQTTRQIRFRKLFGWHPPIRLAYS